MRRSSVKKASRYARLTSSAPPPGVGNSPVSRLRLTRPERADFLCGVVTDREDEIEFGCVGLCELVPTLASERVRPQMRILQLRDSLRSNYSRWAPPSTVGGDVRAALRFIIAWAMMERAEFPVRRNKTLWCSCMLFRHWQQVGLQQGCFGCGFTARTNALMNFPSTCGAIASTSMFWPQRNSRASATR
jgi:hypothetical protein